MSAQTSYNRLTDKGFNGALADLNSAEVVALPAVGAVPFGVIVSDDGDGVSIGGAAVEGIALRDLTRQANTPGSEVVLYDDEEAVSILKKGYVYLTLAAGGTKGDALLFSDSTGVIDVGTAGAGETALTEVTLTETVAAGGVAVCRVQF